MGRKKNNRVQVELGDRAVEKLDTVQKRTETPSRVEVIRNALALYCWVSDQCEAGYEVSFLKKRGGTEIEVDLVGLGFD